MKKNRPKKSFTRQGFVCPAIAAITLSSPTFAQSTQNNDLEEVVVVGSRIARSADFDGPTPVVTIDRSDIDKSGYNNLQQLLERVPSIGNGTFSTRGNNQDSSANGAAAVSLRGLGADATLVLVNGRRVAISSFAESITTNFVDINSIPVSAIERVEILKDGASALYGSDAVAGVVNIVLRENFEGLEVSASYGNTTDTDSDEQSISAIWGINGADDSNLTVIFDYFKNSTLMNRDRGDLGSANQLANGGRDFRSSRGFPGRFIVDGVTTRDPDCPPESSVGSTCFYDYGPWIPLIPEAERTGLTLLGHRSLTDNIEVFTEIAVQRNTSIAQGAPTPLDEEAQLTVPIDHPNNPFPDATTLAIGRYRTVDAGPRRWDIETDNLRMVLGLRGTISDWNWEVSAQRGRSESTQTGSRSQGWVRTDFLQQEIDAGRYNPFGGTFNSQASIDAITTSLVRQGESELTAFEAFISGELIALPSGGVAMAAGVEYRDEDADDTPDDQFQRGLIFGTESVSASASRDITSAYIELAVPLLDNIDMTLATRYDDYSDFGTSTNPMINLRWAPSTSVALRASWGTGFRAPSLAQVGLGPSQESVFFTDDYGCQENPAYCANTDYTIIFSGNPDLDAEESESYNIGIIFEPLDDLRLSLDYWEIEQEDKIDRVSFGFLYNQFCNVQDSDVCVRFDPLPGDTLGGLSSVNSSFINIGKQTVTGIDLAVQYSLDLPGSVLSLRFDYSYLQEYERVEPDPNVEPGTTEQRFISRDLAGEYEYPEHRWSATADWELERWSLVGTVFYTGEFEDTPDIDFDGTLDYESNSSRTVDAFVTLNLQANYSGFSNTLLTLGIDNALDEDPPFAIGDGDTDLYGYVSSQHNPRGQFVYGKVTYTF